MHSNIVSYGSRLARQGWARLSLSLCSQTQCRAPPSCALFGGLESIRCARDRPYAKAGQLSVDILAQAPRLKSAIASSFLLAVLRSTCQKRFFRDECRCFGRRAVQPTACRADVAKDQRV